VLPGDVICKRGSSNAIAIVRQNHSGFETITEARMNYDIPAVSDEEDEVKRVGIPAKMVLSSAALSFRLCNITAAGARLM
jgi:hypothetical protein